MDLQLSGRVAIVTGASKGIGLAVTRTLLEEGVHVVAASRTRTPEADAREGGARPGRPDGPAGARPRSWPARSRSSAGSTSWSTTPAARRPALPCRASGFLTPDDADWQAMFEFNLFSVVRAIRAAIPLMLQRRRRLDRQRLLGQRPAAAPDERRLRRRQVGPEQPQQGAVARSTDRRASG